MYNLKLGEVNHALCVSIKLIEATKRMVGSKSVVYSDLTDIGREIREAASECQRVLKLIKVDSERPLISGQPVDSCSG